MNEPDPVETVETELAAARRRVMLEFGPEIGAIAFDVFDTMIALCLRAGDKRDPETGKIFCAVLMLCRALDEATDRSAAEIVL